MSSFVKNFILQSTGATDLREVEKIQDLWSGYGTIKRYSLSGAEVKSVVVKHVDIPEEGSHPRGWNSNISHQRKLKSYNVEVAWYKIYSSLLDDRCYVPKCYGLEANKESDTYILVMEDLDEAGFPGRKDSVTLKEVKTCLKWLARFHATFLGTKPEGLWETGTYWHLKTRPDELAALKDKDLKGAAQLIDKALSDCPYQTLVHGDAKLANFCFSKDGKSVSAVDFQYVGGGCGMKDVAYLIGSCLDESDCEKYEQELLGYYFDVISNIVQASKKDVNTSALVEQWRSLYPVAWADFHRFIKGWSPGHWKINSYSERLTRNVIESLGAK